MKAAVRVWQRPQRWLIAGAGGLGVLAALWLAGLVWFTGAIPREGDDSEDQTDAIVVLTGGSERLRAGLDLLGESRGKKLFVSGVYRGVDVAALLSVSRQSPDDVACCIVLGYAADNTVGNARETAEWMDREEFHSLRLVTAAYHMPRSLLEFRRAMPHVRVIPHPVFPKSVKQDEWWLWRGTMALVATEYSKYVLAYVAGAFEGPKQSPLVSQARGR